MNSSRGVNDYQCIFGLSSDIFIITMNRHDYNKNYNLKFQQNHGVIVNLLNPPPI
jgi:hypothetical protein